MASTPFPLEPGEKLIRRFDRHWIALLRRASIPLVLWILNTVIFLVRLPDNELDRVNLTLFVLGSLFFLLLIYLYMDWQNDHLYVTNRRVIYDDAVYLFSATRSELLIDSIENVNVETPSVVARQFGYGSVIVQTASRMNNIFFRDAAQPEQAQKVVMDQVAPRKRGLQQERMRQTIEARVMGKGKPPSAKAPVHDLPPEAFGQGFSIIFPANPRKEGDTMIWHKHWIFGFAALLDPLLIMGIVVVSRVLLTDAGIATGTTGTVVFYAIILGIIAWMIYVWADWIDDVYMVDMKNVVDIERHPLGKEDRKQASLAAIQNVASDQPNLLARILGYGDVTLQTAGGSGQFTFAGVPDPEFVQKVVFAYLETFKREQKENERYNVLELIKEYHALQGSAATQQLNGGEQPKPGEPPKPGAHGSGQH